MRSSHSEQPGELLLDGRSWHLKSVKGILNSLENVTEAEVDLTKAEVTVNNNDEESLKELVSAIVDIGYEAEIV